MVSFPLLRRFPGTGTVRTIGESRPIRAPWTRQSSLISPHWPSLDFPGNLGNGKLEAPEWITVSFVMRIKRVRSRETNSSFVSRDGKSGFSFRGWIGLFDLGRSIVLRLVVVGESC